MPQQNATELVASLKASLDNAVVASPPLVWWPKVIGMELIGTVKDATIEDKGTNVFSSYVALTIVSLTETDAAGEALVYKFNAFAACIRDLFLQHRFGVGDPIALRYEGERQVDQGLGQKPIVTQLYTTNIK